jgi:hypothetical protein
VKPLCSSRFAQELARFTFEWAVQDVDIANSRISFLVFSTITESLEYNVMYKAVMCMLAGFIPYGEQKQQRTQFAEELPRLLEQVRSNICNHHLSLSLSLCF